MADLVQFQNPGPLLSVADTAYQFLKARREPIKYKELVQEVLSLKGTIDSKDLPRLMAKAHTEISLDNRFLNRGGGMCGLREWTIKPHPYRVVELANSQRFNPGERLKKELISMDENYQEEPVQNDEPLGEPEESDER